jgi:hypothetical protein
MRVVRIIRRTPHPGNTLIAREEVSILLRSEMRLFSEVRLAEWCVQESLGKGPTYESKYRCGTRVLVTRYKRMDG